MISLHRYKLLLREPHIAGAYLASIIGRLPIGMAVLSILLYVQQVDGSYARAGLASALYVCGVAVVAPLIGRIVDSVGPRLILWISALAYPLALAVLVWAVRHGASTTLLGVAAFAAGAALPPVSSCIRTLVRMLLHDGAQLQAAYSLDSVIMESVFIMGPGIVSLFAAFGWPAGAVGFAALCGMTGAIIFERSSAVSRWSASAVAARADRASVVAAPGLIAIFATTFFYSVGFGLFEVAVTAVAARAGAPAAAGLILAFTSMGSAAGVLWYGSRNWPLSMPNQYKVALACLFAGFLALAPIENLYFYCIVSVLTGAPMSTVLAAQAVLIAAIAPRSALAESFTWSATSLLVGVSLGIAAGGILLERYPPAVPVMLAAAMAGVGLLIASAKINVRTLGLDAAR
jgi:MFS family permease